MFIAKSSIYAALKQGIGFTEDFLILSPCTHKVRSPKPSIPTQDCLVVI
jgi:hypothetical protein